VSVRLYDGGSPHTLRVLASDLVVTARSTLFTVINSANSVPQVLVHEGRVELQRGVERTRLDAGQQWPSESGMTPPVEEQQQALRAHQLWHKVRLLPKVTRI
jgi:hypothetical protein